MTASRGQYAATTAVSSDRSRAEIERVLTRYGAREFMYGWDPNRAIVGFVIGGRQVRFEIPMPSEKDTQFRYSNHKPPRPLTPTQIKTAWEQACRQRWRALALVVKAKLEAVESGIASLENEFLAQLVLPNGQTVGDAVTPRILRGIDANEMPALLPNYDTKEIEA